MKKKNPKKKKRKKKKGKRKQAETFTQAPALLP